MTTAAPASLRSRPQRIRPHAPRKARWIFRASAARLATSARTILPRCLPCRTTAASRLRRPSSPWSSSLAHDATPRVVTVASRPGAMIELSSSPALSSGAPAELLPLPMCGSSVSSTSSGRPCKAPDASGAKLFWPKDGVSRPPPPNNGRRSPGGPSGGSVRGESSMPPPTPPKPPSPRPLPSPPLRRASSLAPPTQGPPTRSNQASSCKSSSARASVARCQWLEERPSELAWRRCRFRLIIVSKARLST
mmetsp:Transcript_79005/g.256130  ORF Transcript_79005/g.256130 Transcript_79005/m.256130 type:complete len:250 (+) Transcript_79005:1457-2206(+)